MTEYTGTEQYIYDCVKNNDITFMPIQRAISLQQTQEDKLEDEVILNGLAVECDNTKRKLV